LLIYAPLNRSSPRVVTGKWLLKNEKLTARLKNKTGTNTQIKNHRNPEHMYLKFLTPLASSVEKIVKLLGFK
jgi:hypothetical protein